MLTLNRSPGVRLPFGSFALSIPQILFLTLVSNTLCLTPLTIEIVAPGNINMFSMTSFPLTAPAFDIGLEELQQKYSGFLRFSLTYLYDKTLTTCDEVTSEMDRILSEYYYRNRLKTNVTVFLFPGCTEGVTVARLGAGWKQLVLSSSYNEPTFRNKALYPNVIEAGPLMGRSIMITANAVHRKLSWKTSYIVCDRTGAAGAEAYIGSLAFSHVLRGTPGTTTYYTAVDTSRGDTYESVLEQIRTVARVVSFWGQATAVRRFLIEAARKNMTNGDYVYMFIAPYEYPTAFTGDPTWQYHDLYDEEARKAFRSLIMVIPSPEGEEAARFRNALAVRLRTMSKESYNFTYVDGDPPTPVVYAGYACMDILGKVLNETYASAPTADYSESYFLAEKFWNAAFATPVGRMDFDEVGDRRMRWDIQQFNETSGVFGAVFRLDPYTFQLIPLKPFNWWTGGDMPLDVPLCGFQGTTGPCALLAEAGKQNLAKIITGVILGTAAILTLGALLTKHIVAKSQLASISWLLHGVSVGKPVGTLPQDDVYMAAPRQLSVYLEKAVTITVLPCLTAGESKPGRKFLVLAKELLGLVHPNVAKFHGVIRPVERVGFVFEHGQRGDLHSFLQQPPITLDRGMKHGLILDLLEGLKALHHLATLRSHGLLNCSNCVIDKHFTMKITNCGVQRMAIAGFGCKVSSTCFNSLPPTVKFHMSPEQLYAGVLATAATASDVFSVGTLCAEIVTEGGACKVQGENLLEGYEASLREMVPHNDAASLIRRCWSNVSTERPSLRELLTCFRARRTQLTVAQKVINRLSKYAGDLEQAVGLRTQALLLERQKCDQILSHMLPVSVVEKLRKSLPIEPEIFDLVTMQFSDIVGFVDFVQSSTPLKVVDFLNKAHGLFDIVISEYDVYKVETIGDSYFIVSGLPRRNDDRHVEQICLTAVRMQKMFQHADFRTAAMDIRIGIHTGPCVAAVVGLQRPRYCLFGDTVNTTSRMETHGDASRIHLSAAAGDFIKHRPEASQHKGHGDLCGYRGLVSDGGRLRQYDAHGDAGKEPIHWDFQTLFLCNSNT